MLFLFVACQVSSQTTDFRSRNPCTFIDIPIQKSIRSPYKAKLAVIIELKACTQGISNVDNGEYVYLNFHEKLRPV